MNPSPVTPSQRPLAPTAPGDLKGVLFDFDGTLVDSYPLIEWAFDRVCRAFNLAPDARELFASARGLPLPEQMRRVSPELWEQLTETYRQVDAQQRRHVRVFPGIVGVLRAARQRGLKLGVVSSKRRLLVRSELEASGLKAYFPVVVALEDAKAAKPDPAPLRKALALMGVKPSQALYVGDTLVDMEAGRRARLHTLLAVWGVPPTLEPEMNGHFPKLFAPRDLLPLLKGSRAA